MPVLLHHETRWECPNCVQTHLTVVQAPHTPYHRCRGLHGILAPFVTAGTRCKVQALPRDDYVGGEQGVTYDSEGAAIMSVITVKDDSQACAVLAPLATGKDGPLMAWVTSHMFRQWLADCMLRNQTGLNFATDTFRAALYNGTITPDENCTAALSAYNAGSSAWLTANEVFSGAAWIQTGVALTGTSGTTHFSDTVDAVWFDAADTASTGAVSFTAYGDLVYDDTLAAPVAKQGVAFHYYGGAQTVVSDVFTVIWPSAGVWRLTV